MRRYALPALILAAAGTLALPAGAGPVCTGTLPDPVCGGRVVAEPTGSLTFLQYTDEVFPALEAIEQIAPEIVEVFTLAELTGNPQHDSFDGNPVPVFRITDESKPSSGKRKVVFSLSVHGNEPAGREGGVRYLEDLARWWVDDPDHPLYAGDTAYPLDDVLAVTEVWAGIPNTDGWSDGDIGSGVFNRGNGNDVDLNRQFPTMGWPHPSQSPLSEPESAGWAEFVRSLGRVHTASDIHGELTSADNAFSDLMFPADEWDPDEQARALRLGLNAYAGIERKFAEYGVVLGDLTGATATMKPASAATAYDVVGYDDAGFMGDWFGQATGAIDIDAENFFSHSAPGNVWVGLLEEAHVAAVRGIMEAVITTSMTIDDVKADISLGRVAYVFDPARVTAPATPASGEDRARKAIDVSRMAYFDDLRAATGSVVDPIDSGSVATADLTAYDSLVIADVAFPEDRLGRTVDDVAYLAALQRFVADGGQLVLTDKAVQLLGRLGFHPEDDMRSALTNAGHVDFGAHDHAWEQQLLETASQTYYEVPLGFPATDAAPHYGIASAAWDEAGGTTVGTVDGTDTFTALGELPRGMGKISILGAVLPTPSIEEDSEDGLADYGVTITGGQVFHAILAYRRPGVAPAPVTPPVQPGPGPANPRPDPGSLPSTGGAPWLAIAALVSGASAWALRRIRSGSAT